LLQAGFCISFSRKLIFVTFRVIESIW